MTKRNCSVLLAAAVLCSAVGLHADVFLQVTPEAINPTLQANGWSGYLLTLVSDVPDEPIVGIDLKNNNQGQYVGVPGIIGPLHQAWTIDQIKNPGTVIPTPTGILPTDPAQRTDSCFLNASLYWEVEDPFTENATSNNPLYTQSPLPNDPGDPATQTNGTQYAVGSSMTFSGTIHTQVARQSLDLAFVIVPTDSSAGPVTINGIAVTMLGQVPQDTIIQRTIQPGPAPRSSDFIYWTANAPSPSADAATWDLNNNHNWTNIDPAVIGPDIFLTGDGVIFDDVHNTNGNYNVTLNSLLAPRYVKISSSNTYTIAGAGGITGNAYLDKYGTGTLILATTANSYTGATTISAGTIQLGADNALSPNSPLTIANGTLDLAGHSLQLAGLATAYGTVNAAIINSGNTPAILTFATTSKWGYAYNGSIADGPGAATTALTFESGTLTLGGSCTYTGPTIVNGGTLNAASLASKTIVVNSGGALNCSGLTSSPDLTVNGKATFGSTAATINALHGNGTLTVYNPLTISGLVDYTGHLYAATTINGALTSNSFNDTALTIGPSGKITSAGSITGPVTLAGALSPGDAQHVAQLTFYNPLTLAAGSTMIYDVGTGAANSDLVHFHTLADNLHGSGVLTLQLEGAVDYLQTYTIFDNVTTPNFQLAAIDLSGVTDPNPSYLPIFGPNDPNNPTAYTLSFIDPPVPEPATLLIFLPLAALPLLTSRRRPPTHRC